MIIIHAFLNVKLEKHKEFLEVANQMTISTQEEDGCIGFNFYEDPAEKGKFVFIEKFKDEDANKYHKQTSHFKTFVEGLSDFLSEPLQAEVYDASKRG